MREKESLQEFNNFHTFLKRIVHKKNHVTLFIKDEKAKTTLHLSIEYYFQISKDQVQNFYIKKINLDSNI